MGNSSKYHVSKGTFLRCNKDYNNPSSRARATACVRLETASFARMLLTCRLAVPTAITSRSATSSLGAPAAISSKITSCLQSKGFQYKDFNGAVHARLWLSISQESG